MTELFGDPLVLAPLQFRMAEQSCAHCRSYHGLWPYRRLARMVVGIEITADIVQDLMRKMTPPGGRILIAGSADAGILAMTASATRELKPSIDVVDRCPTPLATCRRYAETHDISFTPIELDLRVGTPAGRYDLVFGDCFLQFMPRADRVAFLRRIGGTLTERGTLIFVERRHTGREESSLQRDHALETMDALAAQGVELPEDRDAFRLRLERTAEERRKRLTPVSDRLDLVLHEAGFDVSDTERLRTGTLPNGETVTMEVAVGSPALVRSR